MNDGYDDMEVVLALTDAELEAIGVKPGHRKKMRMYIDKAASQPSSHSSAIPPTQPRSQSPKPMQPKSAIPPTKLTQVTNQSSSNVKQSSSPIKTTRLAPQPPPSHRSQPESRTVTSPMEPSASPPNKPLPVPAKKQLGASNASMPPSKPLPPPKNQRELAEQILFADDPPSAEQKVQLDRYASTTTAPLTRGSSIKDKMAFLQKPTSEPQPLPKKIETGRLTNSAGSVRSRFQPTESDGDAKEPPKEEGQKPNRPKKKSNPQDYSTLFGTIRGPWEGPTSPEKGRWKEDLQAEEVEEPEEEPLKLICIMKAVDDYTAEDRVEISFKKNNMIEIYEKHESGWWKGQVKNTDKIGLFPSNFVKEDDAGVSQSKQKQEKKEMDETDEFLANILDPMSFKKNAKGGAKVGGTPVKKGGTLADMLKARTGGDDEDKPEEKSQDESSQAPTKALPVPVKKKEEISAATEESEESRPRSGSQSAKDKIVSEDKPKRPSSPSEMQTRSLWAKRHEDPSDVKPEQTAPPIKAQDSDTPSAKTAVPPKGVGKMGVQIMMGVDLSQTQLKKVSQSPKVPTAEETKPIPVVALKPVVKSASQENPVQPPPAQAAPPVVSPAIIKAKCLHTYEGESESELSFQIGDIIDVKEKDGDWWCGDLQGKMGWFPASFVEEIL
eukprot:TRINITY_DN6443_c0_g1_i1.p1 TRINITY_DN6443_c0_g1~~TRINITY_DN6443_c0_g1_i1.p1  ORF type:complete len:690 (-),score=214.54 TRINITY_DN6443_c0_g1_i1:2-1999(-)